jgi:hypothetical protein
MRMNARRIFSASPKPTDSAMRFDRLGRRLYASARQIGAEPFHDTRRRGAGVQVSTEAVVTRDTVLTAGHVGALMLRNRRNGVERDRVPHCFCTALPHIMRKGKGEADVRAHNLEATIGSTAARKAEIVQKHRHCDQFGIRSEPATLCQLRAIEPRARITWLKSQGCDSASAWA